MPKYVAVNAISVPIPDRTPPKNRLIRATQEIEMSEEDAKPYLEAGNIRPAEGDESEQAETEQKVEENPEQVDPNPDELTQEQYDELASNRPGNSASKETWLAYANTVPGVQVATDAKRDDIVARVDERLNELQPS